MKIIVCLKQVPETNNVKIDPVTHNLQRNGISGVINSFDVNAIEAALELKDRYDAEVVALTMGPPDYEKTLRLAMAMGADEGVLLSSRGFAGADTLATATVLAAAVKKIGGADLILFGRQAVDADTGQVGPLVAEKLDLPQYTYVSKLNLSSDGQIEAVRMLDGGTVRVNGDLPAVVTVRSELNEPRYATPRNIKLSFKKDIVVYDEKDLELDDSEIGQAGSPTIVTKVYTPTATPKVTETLEGSATEAAQNLLTKLSEKSIL